MTYSASFKLRTIGGASVLAISAGVAVPAAAQMAPAPLAAAPAAPTAPVQPANIEQCAETDTDFFVCAPGTDPDGVGDNPADSDPADPIRITIESGAFVTGSNGFLSGASVTGDIGTVVINRGSIVGGANGAAILNNDSAFNNLGFVSSDFDLGIRTVENVVVRNSGTIYGNSTLTLINGLSGTTVFNTGLIQNDAGPVLLVAGDGNPDTVTTVRNTVTGSIFGAADNSALFDVNDELEIDNAGLIQAFGADSSVILARQTLDLTNTGNIVNESGTTIVATGLADIRNDFGGLIEARDGNAIDLGADASRVINNETIIATERAINAAAQTDIVIANNGAISGGMATVIGGSNLLLVNRGSIDTTGDFAVAARDGFVLRNLGDISATGIAVRSGEDAVIENNGGSIISDTGRALFLAGSAEVTNDTDGIISGAVGIDALLFADIRNNEGALIESTAGDAITLNVDGSRVINLGTISATGGNAVDATGLADIVVANNAIMTSDDITVIGGDNLTVVNRDTLTSTGADAIVSDGMGLEVRNLGTLTAGGGDGVRGEDGVTFENSGSITATGGDAVEVNYGMITNSGSLVSTDGNGIFFDVSAVESTVTNEAGATISGDVGIRVDSANTGGQTVVNFGTITGSIGEAAFLGDGEDEFQQWTGAVVDGNIRLGGGDDIFVLEGSLSSINGLVLAGPDTDTAILGGVLDADNLVDFEAISLGQMFDLTVSGARSLTGDVSVDGNVFLGLGVDSIAVDGDVDLAGGTITVGTPLGQALLGQTVSLITATGTLTDNGTAFTILDDDLLVDYARIAGTADIQVTGVNPLIGAGDGNVVAAGNALFGGLNAGTLSDANFAALNALPDATALQNALLDALPSLSDGVGREIFETSSAASDALDRHLMREESSIWGQIIVRGADQDALSQSVAGYDADETIFTIGGDFAFGESIVIGALVSYADIDITDTTTGTSAVNSDVESIKLGLYTGIELLERGFFNAEVAYLTGDVDTDINGGFFGPITSGYDFDGITARATLGYDLLPDENVWLTPSIGVNYADISFDDTVETGGFGFTVERGDAEFLELRGAVELGAQLSEKVTGFVKGTVIYDTEDSVRSFRLSSAQLPTFSAVLPGREQNRFELAAGLDANLTDTIAIGVGYLGDFSDGYDGHAGRATIRIGF